MTWDSELGWELEKALCRGVSLDEWLSCKRKVRYGHPHTAEDACTAMYKKTGDILVAYECRHDCGGWHIGHDRPGKKIK